jgi:hypothetical protein
LSSMRVSTKQEITQDYPGWSPQGSGINFFLVQSM